MLIWIQDIHHVVFDPDYYCGVSVGNIKMLALFFSFVSVYSNIRIEVKGEGTPSSSFIIKYVHINCNKSSSMSRYGV